ncbi:MAG: hypothetical protein RM347_030540 [Nostoc sp. ChiQUE02]|uniref:hypothetical protein n=1 Tax=Nostoc sp. ChiQUE02 TaxID=3075377 RepID=UPI002AD30F9B|nr:hypothetical protein [Nostoc sp. ChiQUE02]MDZ8234847.1 hypothetical protein [Nostoc sp. ChiQUE02]
MSQDSSEAVFWVASYDFYIARQKGEQFLSLSDIQSEVPEIQASMPAPPALSRPYHITGH